MSAFVVDRAHIRFLIEAALRFTGRFDKFRFGEGKILTETNATEIGQLLWNENVKSVRTRYPDDPFNLPGPIGEEPYEYKHVPAPMIPIDALDVLSSSIGYEYQTCEHDEWDTSEARAFIQELKEWAIRKLPGYGEAAYGAPVAFRMERTKS